MSKTFNLQRFKHLIIRERHGALLRTNQYLAPILGICVINRISNGAIFGSNLEYDFKILEIIILTSFFSLISYGIVFPHVHSKNINYSFAMLPSSTLEKFLVMSVYSIIFMPLLMFVAYFMIDTFLTALPFIKMNTYIWQEFSTFNIHPYFWVIFVEYCLLFGAISALTNLYIRNIILKIIVPIAIGITLFILALFVSKFIGISMGDMLLYKDGFTILDIAIMGTALLIYAFTYLKMKHLKY